MEVGVVAVLVIRAPMGVGVGAVELEVVVA